MSQPGERITRFPATPRAVAALLEGLPGFCLGLRNAAGYGIDPNQVLNASRLVLDLAGRGELPPDLADLAGRLGTVLCTSPEEQREFPDRFTRWLEQVVPRESLGPGPISGDDEFQASDDSDPVVASRRITSTRRRVFRATFAAFLVLAGLAGYLIYRSSKPPSPNVLAAGGGLPPDLKTQEKPQTPESRTVAGGVEPPKAPQKSAVGQVRPAVAIQPLGTDWPFGVRLALAAAGVYGLSAGLIWGLLRWARRNWDRTAMVLRRGKPGESGGPTRAMRPRPVRVWSHAERRALRDAARVLRDRIRVLDPHRIDVRATLERAVRSVGPVALVPEARRHAIEHVAMVDRRGSLDHAADLADALLDSLERDHVHVVRFAFHREPRYLLPRWRGERSWPLEEVLGRHRVLRLLIWTDGSGLIDPYSGRPGQVAQALKAWPRRALLTPVPAASWSHRETGLMDEGFAVAPATPMGLRLAARWLAQGESDDGFAPATGRRGVPLGDPEGGKPLRLPDLLRSDPDRWLGPVVPEPEELEELFRGLHLFLDEDFTWLAGCAAYPEVSWQVTLAIGRALGRVGGSTARAAGPALARLARLPWFRHGSMPDWLRMALLTELPAADRVRIRGVLDALLEGSPLDDLFGVSESSGSQLAIGIPEDRLRTDLRRSLLAHEATPPELANDRVVADFLDGRNPSQLDVALPERLRRLLDAKDAGYRPVLDRGATPGGFLGLLVAWLRSWSVAPPGTSSPGGSSIVVREWPSHLVRTLAYRPDGLELASSGGEGTIQIWNARDGRLRTSLTGREGFVRSLVYSPNGRELASAGEWGEIRIWDVVTGEVVQTLIAHDYAVFSLAYRPDGKELAAACIDGRIYLWDAVSGQLLRKMGEDDYSTMRWSANQAVDRRSVLSVAYRPDGQELASAGADGEIRLWDCATGRQHRKLITHERPVRSVAYRPDGLELASAGDEGTVRLWDARTGELRRSHVGHELTINSVAYSPDGRELAFAGSDGAVRFWETKTDRFRSVTTGHEGGQPIVAYSPDGRELAHAGLDDTIRVWDLSMIPYETEIGTVRRATQAIGHVTGRALRPAIRLAARSFLAVGTVMAGALGKASPRPFASPTREPRRRRWSGGVILGGYVVLLALMLIWAVPLAWTGPIGPSWPGTMIPLFLAISLVTQAGSMGLPWFLAGSRRAAGWLACELVHLWSLVPLTLAALAGLATCWTTLATARAPVLTPYTEQSISRGLLGQLPPWFERRIHIPVPHGYVNSVAYSPDGRTIAAGYHGVGGGGVVIWEPSSGRQLFQAVREGGVTSVAYSHDGKSIAAGYSLGAEGGGGVVVWESSSGRRASDAPLAVREGGVTSVAYSHDGKAIAAGYSLGAEGGGGVVVWESSSGRRASDAPLAVRNGNVTSVAYSPDGKAIAAGLRYLPGSIIDGGVEVWESSGGRRLMSTPLPVAEGDVTSVAYSPDGKRIAAGYGGFKGGVVVFEASSGRRLSDASMEVREGSVTSVAYSPDGKAIAAGYGSTVGAVEGGVLVWESSSGRRLSDSPPEVMEGGVASVAYSPDGKAIAAGYGVSSGVGVGVGGVLVWEVSSGRRLFAAPLAMREGGVTSVAYSPDGKAIAAGYGRGAEGGGGVVMWEVSSGRRLFAAPLAVREGGGVTSVAYSPDGKAIAAGSEAFGGGGSGGVLVWEMSSGRQVLNERLPQAGHIRDVVYSPDGKAIAAGYGYGYGIGTGGGVVVWEVSSGRRLFDAPLAVREGGVTSVAYSPDGKAIAAGYGRGQEGGVVVWGASSGRRLFDASLAVKDGIVTRVACSLDGQAIAAGYGRGEGGGVVVWEASSGRRLSDVHLPSTGRIRSVAFSPSGRSMICGGSKSLWDFSQAPPARIFEETSSSTVTGIEFDPNGSGPGRPQALVMGRFNGDVRIRIVDRIEPWIEWPWLWGGLALGWWVWGAGWVAWRLWRAPGEAVARTHRDVMVLAARAGVAASGLAVVFAAASWPEWGGGSAFYDPRWVVHGLLLAAWLAGVAAVLALGVEASHAALRAAGYVLQDQPPPITLRGSIRAFLGLRDRTGGRRVSAWRNAAAPFLRLPGALVPIALAAVVFSLVVYDPPLPRPAVARTPPVTGEPKPSNPGSFAPPILDLNLPSLGGDIPNRPANQSRPARQDIPREAGKEEPKPEQSKPEAETPKESKKETAKG